MNAWKSSTLVVLATFSVSVVLLFAKADMMRERASAGRPLVTNHIYSPAAADPDLRNAEKAKRMSRPFEPAPKTATVSVITRQPELPPAPEPTPTRQASLSVPTTEQTSASAKTATAPAGETKSASAKTNSGEYKPADSHRFYVVVGTFTTRQNALKGLADMQRRGLKESFIGVFDEGKYVSVIARAFEREDQARIMLSELDAKHSINGYIYHKVD